MQEWVDPILDRWNVVTFIMGAAAAIVYNRARAKFEADRLSAEVAVLREQVVEMQGRIARGDTQFAVLTTEIGFIKASMDRIEQHLTARKG